MRKLPKCQGVSASCRKSCHLLFFVVIFLPIKPPCLLKSRHWWVRLPAVTPLLSPSSSPPAKLIRSQPKMCCFAGWEEGWGNSLWGRVAVRLFIINFYFRKGHLADNRFSSAFAWYSKNSNAAVKTGRGLAGAVCCISPWRMTNWERPLCIPCPR